jgi:hypothetical protein
MSTKTYYTIEMGIDGCWKRDGLIVQYACRADAQKAIDQMALCWPSAEYRIVEHSVIDPMTVLAAAAWTTRKAADTAWHAASKTPGAARVAMWKAYRRAEAEAKLAEDAWAKAVGT